MWRLHWPIISTATPKWTKKLTRGGSLRFLTTEDTEKFGESAAVFMPHTEGAVEKIVL